MSFRGILVGAWLTLFGGAAMAQVAPGAGVVQQGAVTAGDCAIWVQNGVIKDVGPCPGGGGSGTVTSVDVSGGTTGLTTSGGPVTGAGTITIAGTLAAANGGTGLNALGAGISTFLGTPTSANLAAAVTDETGSGGLVFANGPALLGTVGIGSISISGPSAGAVKFGADAAAPQAYTFSVPSVLAGTTNIAGALTTINLSAGTGTGLGGTFKLMASAAGTTGSAQNALADVFDYGFSSTGAFTIFKQINIAGGAAIASTGSINSSVSLNANANAAFISIGATADTLLCRASAGVFAVGTTSCNGLGSLTAVNLTATTAVIGPAGSATTPGLQAGTGGYGVFSGGGSIELAATGSVVAFFNTSGSAVTGTWTIGNLATGTGSYVCATAGLLTIEAVACPASNKDLKNPLGYLNQQEASRQLDDLRSAIYTYKDGDGAPGEHVGLYAQDVAKLDPRCAAYSADGKIQNYDPNCLIAYLVADRQTLRSEISSIKHSVSHRYR